MWHPYLNNRSDIRRHRSKHGTQTAGTQNGRTYCFPVVTSSNALATSRDALVTSSNALLVAMHLSLGEAMGLHVWSLHPELLLLLADLDLPQLPHWPYPGIWEHIFGNQPWR